jgi:AraC family transcriptional regulator, transcriptional activator of pobA
MNQLFHIFTSNAEDALQIASNPPKPHRHDYEELIIGVEGRLEHFIDFKTTVFEAPFATFVAKGKTHWVQPQVVNNRCDMWVLRFKSEFIPETTFQLYAHYHDHANITMPRGACFTRLTDICQMIAGEMAQPMPDLAVVRHLLGALFTMIESERHKQTPENAKQPGQNTTFKNFLTILEDNFRRPEGVEFYAEKLFMSARNLNLVCQQILQKSVSEIIETRKLIEAKNLLTTTDLTVAEIGYELGYNEKAYFTQVFKKKSGQTPTEFRDEMRRLVVGNNPGN